MINLAGSSFDFGSVLFAVLQECEHRRRGLIAKDEKDKLMEIAREKLAEVHQSFVESGGAASYWRELEKEVLDNAMVQYAEAAVAQTALERSNYGIWRSGDPLARGLFTLGGLALGGLMIAAPFIPIAEDAFAFVLAGTGFFWPDIKRMVSDYRHARLLNKLIVQAEKYQKDSRIHYVSSHQFDEALQSLHAGTDTAAEPSPPLGPRRMGPAEEGTGKAPGADSPPAPPAGRRRGRESG